MYFEKIFLKTHKNLQGLSNNTTLGAQRIQVILGLQPFIQKLLKVMMMVVVVEEEGTMTVPQSCNWLPGPCNVVAICNLPCRLPRKLTRKAGKVSCKLGLL